MGLGARLPAVTKKRATGSPGTNGMVGPMRRVVQIPMHGLLSAGLRRPAVMARVVRAI
jgi:hypothetical protein